RRLRQRRRRHRQPGRLEPLQLRDPRRARAARGTDRRSPSVGHRASRGMASPQRGLGARCAPRPRQGSGRLPRSARVPRGEGGRMTTSRLQGLAAGLKLPLLVTNLVNIRYLTGFDSSNAALLVRPDGEATLFTDFRYIESARQVEGVDPQLANRSLIPDLAKRLSGRIQFEADVLPYAEWEVLEG